MTRELNKAALDRWITGGWGEDERRYDDDAPCPSWCGEQELCDRCQEEWAALEQYDYEEEMGLSRRRGELD
jgi:hypothetical protein